MHTDIMSDRKMPKPFDINLAKQGHPICFRNGKECSIENISVDGRILVSFKVEKDPETTPKSALSLNSLIEYAQSGSFNEFEESENKESEHDLVMLEVSPHELSMIVTPDFESFSSGKKND